MPQWNGVMDGYLRKNLDLAKKIIRKDWDMVFCVDGYEGSGKSVLAQQCCKYCDPTFNLSRISFKPDDFLKSINNAEKFQAILYDEAYDGMSSRASMMDVNRTLMGALAEIRQKNLFVFIVMPCFFELDKYAAVWRSRALLHVYTGNEFERGRFSFYAQDKKKLLYVLGKKFYSYKKPAPNFFGKFPAGYAVDEAKYRALKLNALKHREKSLGKNESPKATRVRTQRNIAILKLLELKMKQKDVATLLKLTDRQIRTICTEMKRPIKKAEIEKGEEL